MIEPIFVIIVVTLFLFLINNKKSQDMIYRNMVTVSSIIISMTITTMILSKTISEDGNIKSIIPIMMVSVCNLFVYLREKYVYKETVSQKYTYIMHGFVLGLSGIFYICGFKYVAQGLSLIVVAFYFNYCSGINLVKNMKNIIPNMYVIVLSASITMGLFLGNKSLEAFWNKMIPSLTLSCIIVGLVQIYMIKKYHAKMRYD